MAQLSHSGYAARDNFSDPSVLETVRSQLTTKIHALVDANGLPVLLKLTQGQAHDGRSAVDMVGDIGPGQVLLADRGYDSDALRQTLADQGAWGNIKPMPGRVNIPVFSPFLYRLRNHIERFFKQAQTLQSDRDALQKTRRQLSRARQTCRSSNLDAIYESVSLVGGEQFGALKRAHFRRHQALRPRAESRQQTVARFDIGKAVAAQRLHMNEYILGAFAARQEAKSANAIEPFHDDDLEAADLGHLNMGPRRTEL
jgi:transposase